MKKQLLMLLLGLVSVLSLYANEEYKGIITGKITTSDGEPAASVTIQVKGAGRSTMTNEKGRFTIRNIEAGDYELEISLTGHETITKKITVEKNKTVNVAITLSISRKQLNEVVVSASRTNKDGEYVAKMPLKEWENPQVYNSVSSEIIKQQVITTYDDAFRNVPGISRTWESTGRAGDGAAYFALRGFDAQPALINGLPGLTSGNLDVSNVEEIQVIKGPSATLFGGSFYSYGGLINTITKKPYFNFGGELAYNVGSYGLSRVTADINTPLSKTEKIALRVNAAYHTENSFQDAGYKKSFFIAPSITYKVNDRLTFDIMTEILEEERAVAPVFFHSDREHPLRYNNIKELNLNNNLSFMSNDLPIKNPRFNFQAQMSYKLSDQWTSQTVLSRGTAKSNGYYTYIWEDIDVDNGDIRYFNQYFHKEQQTTTSIDIQQNFNGDFKIGSLRDRLLIGLDFFNNNVIDNGSGWVAVREVTPQESEVDVDHLGAQIDNPVYLSQSLVDQMLATSGGTNSNITNSSYSAYVSNVINLTPGLMAMLSLRADQFESKGEKSTKEDDFNQFALSPKLGIVYQPVLDKLSFFANYMNAFINVAPQEVFDADGVSNGHIKSFKPEHADQLEFGVKTSLLSDKLNATLSFYNIKVTDRVTVLADNRFDYDQRGNIRSRGFELDMNANPCAGLNLIAGYSYNESKVITGDGTDFYSEAGRSAGGQGPQNLANLWATYKFTTGKIKNFGIGFGGNYASEYRVIDNSVVGIFDLPSYALLNGSLFYNGDKFRVTLNVNNITDKVYYIGYWSVNPQKQRNFAASLAYKF